VPPVQVFYTDVKPRLLTQEVRLSLVCLPFSTFPFLITAEASTLLLRLATVSPIPLLPDVANGTILFSPPEEKSKD
jgi:hypothetical protein